MPIDLEKLKSVGDDLLTYGFELDLNKITDCKVTDLFNIRISKSSLSTNKKMFSISVRIDNNKKMFQDILNLKDFLYENKSLSIYMLNSVGTKDISVKLSEIKNVTIGLDYEINNKKDSCKQLEVEVSMNFESYSIDLNS